MGISNATRRSSARPGNRRPSNPRARGWGLAGGLLIVALGLTTTASLSALGGLAKATIAGAPLLEDGQKAILSGLQYGRTFSAEVRSIRLALDDGEGEKLIGRWILIGSNTSGNPHLVDINVRLVDDEGKRLTSNRKKAMLKPSTEEQEIEIEFEIPRKRWEQAHHLQIQANFRIH